MSKKDANTARQSKIKNMQIVIGLGNIGDKYTNTRHNCGFMAVEEFAKQLSAKNNCEIEWKLQKKLKAHIAKTTLNGEQIILAKPTTLMNLSGESAVKLLNFYSQKPSNLIVILDDIDLPLGKVRLKLNGSAGTHNGMKSIIEKINTKDFKRIKIGIESRGTTAPKQMDLSTFVLNNFREDEKKQLKTSIKEAVKKIKETIEEK